MASGFEIRISNKKQPAIVAIKTMTSASSSRKPRFCRYRMTSTSSAVMAIPQGSGMPNRRLSAIAEPITSARSQAAIAISHSTQSPSDTGRE